MKTIDPGRLLIILGLSIAAALFLRGFGIERISVASRSMEPALAVDSRWWVNKLVPKFARVRRGDIIVFASPVDPERELIKRVIALEDDVIELSNKEVRLNDKPLQESYAEHRFPETLFKGDFLGPLTVPQGHLFVLGDNRDESGDSREWKDPSTGKRIYFVPLNSVKGRIIGP